MHDTSDEYNGLIHSKTQDKQAALDMQQMGEQLMTMKPAERARLPLTQELIAALEEARRIKSLEARRRHAQFIGKLMRRAEHALIEQALVELHNPARKLRLQDWLEQAETADSTRTQQLLQQLLNWYPHADRQHLRNLLRNVQQKHCAGDADAALVQAFRHERRKLSHYLNELELAAPLLSPEQLAQQQAPEQ
jgi:ribosome-associated protein